MPSADKIGVADSEEMAKLTQEASIVHIAEDETWAFAQNGKTNACIALGGAIGCVLPVVFLVLILASWSGLTDGRPLAISTLGCMHNKLEVAEAEHAAAAKLIREVIKCLTEKQPPGPVSNTSTTQLVVQEKPIDFLESGKTLDWPRYETSTHSHSPNLPITSTKSLASTDDLPAYECCGWNGRLGNHIEAMLHAIITLQSSQDGGVLSVHHKQSIHYRHYRPGQKCNMEGIFPCEFTLEVPRVLDIAMHVACQKPEGKYEGYQGCFTLPTTCCQGQRWEDYQTAAQQYLLPMLEPAVLGACAPLDEDVGSQTLHIHLRYGDSAKDPQQAGRQPPCTAYKIFMDMYSDELKYIRIVGEKGHPCIDYLQKWKPGSEFIADYHGAVCELMNAYNLVSFGSSFTHSNILFSSNLRRVLTSSTKEPNLGGSIGKPGYTYGNLFCERRTDPTGALRWRNKLPTFLMHKVCAHGKCDDIMPGQHNGQQEKYLFAEDVTVTLEEECRPAL